MIRRDEAAAAAEALARAVEREDFSGWDPYDALSSPLLGSLGRSARLRQAFIQLFKRSPVNLRPLFRVPRRQHTKAVALFVSAYALLDDPERVRSLAELLVERAIPAGDGLGWGYDFDVQTRWGHYRRGQPNAVVTSFAGQALLDAHELVPGGGFDEPARGAVRYALDRLLVDREGKAFFAYYDGAQTPIHNASALVAALCARLGDGDDRVDRAFAYLVARQRPDGTWPYGEAAGLEWVDGFHTAYVLEALASRAARGGDSELESALDRGLDAYLTRLIDPDGAPRASLYERYPLDVHAAASAIRMLSLLASRDPRAAEGADRVLGWTLANLVRRDGRFAFQLHRRHAKRVPYIRWSDGHMLLALATYLERRPR